MDPLLIDVPQQIGTARLLLRCPRTGDGATLNAAICESIDELRPWMAWAQKAPTLDESEAYCRRTEAQFALRECLTMLLFANGTSAGEGRLIGAAGLHDIEWPLRYFQLGYWRRTGQGGQGFVAEAVQALTRMAFDRLAANRLEIRMDARNLPSARVAERAGFAQEGVLRRAELDPSGQPRDTRIYARVRGAEEA